jgi:uncharacterized protein YndB with AHSA1/START domain
MPERIERELLLETSPAAVWMAVTDSEWLAEWLADEVKLELQPGGEAWFRFGDETRTGWVEEITPPGSSGVGRLAFWWAVGSEPASRVELELTGDGDGPTRLRVTETRPLEVLDLVGLRLPGLGGGSYGPALVAA